MPGIVKWVRGPNDNMCQMTTLRQRCDMVDTRLFSIGDMYVSTNFTKINVHSYSITVKAICKCMLYNTSNLYGIITGVIINN